jgi:hypothetical protein
VFYLYTASEYTGTCSNSSTAVSTNGRQCYCVLQNKYRSTHNRNVSKYLYMDDPLSTDNRNVSKYLYMDDPLSTDNRNVSKYLHMDDPLSIPRPTNFTKLPATVT